MKQKKTFYSELAYVFGILFLALGTALMEKANFGMSMVVAPAYLVYLKLSEVFPFFTFGMAEYCHQFILLLLLFLILRKVRLVFFFSFLTAVCYGFVLDGFVFLVSFLPTSLWIRIACFLLGMLSCSIGVAFIFKTYLAPEVYELTVKEIARTYRFPISKVKTIYDLTSLLISVAMSFFFFGLWNFVGVGIGTLITALCNGYIIGKISVLLDRKLNFVDRWNFRKFLEQ